jgi:hypothetical protein
MGGLLPRAHASSGEAVVAGTPLLRRLGRCGFLPLWWWPKLAHASPFLVSNQPSSDNIGGVVMDQGESPSRCLLVRTTATLVDIASFLKMWSLVPTVPLLSFGARGNPMSSLSDNAAVVPRRRSFLEDVVEATWGEADMFGGWGNVMRCGCWLLARACVSEALCTMWWMQPSRRLPQARRIPPSTR